MSSPYRLRRLSLAIVFTFGVALLVFPFCTTAQEQGHPVAEPKARFDPHDKKDEDGKEHDKKASVHKEPSLFEDLKKLIPQLTHVIDVPEFHFFDVLEPRHVHLPTVLGVQITKYMVLELIAALLVILIYVPLAWRIRSGEPARGVIANTFEVLLAFVRDQIARPNLGDKTDRYVPFLWTLFLFILFNNLLGMLPFGGSPTASPMVTMVLALIVFFAIHGAAIYEMGTAPAHGHDDHAHDGHDGHAAHGHDAHAHDHGHAAPQGGVAVLMAGASRYIKSFWPVIDLPDWPLGIPIKTLVFFLEVMGVLVRNGVLAIRLFANMFAGHMVTATILYFIQQTADMNVALWGTVTISSVLGIVALSLLELFVAFLQAYIFTFLTSLFMGMAMTPQH